MAEYIEREALFRSIAGDVAPFNVAMVFRHIHNAPAADVVPVRYGRRLHRKNGVAYCSECKIDTVEDETNYCPNCGATMKLED